MLRIFNMFKDLLYDNKIKTPNKFFDEMISKFTFLFHSKENPYDHEILRIPNETQIIIADEYNELNKYGQSTNKYYILTFSQILLIIDQNDFILYQDFFIKEKNSTIFCLNDNLQKEIEELVLPKDPNISLHFSQKTELHNLSDEINNFKGKHAIISTKYSKIKTIVEILNKSIIAFLIRKSYIKSNINRIKNSSELYKPVSYGKDDINNYIVLRHLSSNPSSLITLVMNENNGQLFALKKRFIGKDEMKLFNRENYDYSTINHPYLLRYYGTIFQQDQISLILEFVNGGTLDEIDLSKFDDIEKLNLIFSIMIIIQYIHFHNFIYRDLKPNNLMIDQNNSIVLIDLDQMVKNTNENTGANSTHNFAHDYSAPEISVRDDIIVTEKVDIYSLGWVINFIMNNKKEFNFKGFPSKFIELLKICEQCVVEDPENRPSISKVIASFISNVYLNSIQKVTNNETEKNLFKMLENNLTFSENINDPDALYAIGIIYGKGICIESNYEKAIEFLNRAASQNHSDSILYLGKISLLIYKDKKTAYELFQKAADLGNQYAQLQMGIFYATPQNKNYDIQKAIHYFTLSSKQNNPQAQYNLGQMYIISKDIPQNIPKGIELYKLAAKQKIAKAQYNLGVFYFEGKFVKRDSDEAIKYLMAAADQNHVDAQYYLGLVYYEGKNFIHKIDKAIHYATLAANKNKIEAQRLLGNIYLSKIPAFHVSKEGENHKISFNKQYSLDYYHDDLDKSIHYYSMAARQNDYQSISILYNIYMIIDVGFRSSKIFEYYESQYNFFLNNHYFKFNKKLIEYNGPLYGNNIEEVINYLKDLSDQNDLQAKFALAFIYLDNVYVEKDVEKAIQYLTESADQGYLKSQMKISMIYLHGKIIKQDIEKGIEYLVKAAKQNDYEANTRLFNVYTNGEYISLDMNKVNELLDSIENQKNLKLLKKFACICYEGKLIKKDINRVTKYLEIAENQGCIEATVQLGILYFEGKDVKKNYSKAFQYFSKASKRNNSYGQFYIGLMYFEGKGVQQNYFKSLHFFIQSSIQKNKYAIFYISMFLLDGKYIKKDVNKALFYLHKFCYNNPALRYIYASIKIDGLYANLDADTGIFHLLNQLCGIYERTYLKLGLIYTEGKFVKRCINSAIFYFSKFLTNPLYDIQYNTFFYKFKDRYSHHDIMKSIIYENSNLFNDNKQKKFLFEILFSKGKYNKADINRIFYYFLNEASKNNPVDQFVIGSFYYEGINIKKDIKKSMQFFYYSSMQGYEDSMLALAVILTDGKYIERDIEKVIHLVSMTKSRIHSNLLFILGSLYYEGKYVQKNFNSAINFFKDSSNFDNFYSKNNLGVLNRNGINVTKNQQQAVIYFQESIKINNDDNVASYNLAHLYFFENQIYDLNKLFDLLVKLVNKGLFCAFELLCLIVYENYRFSKIDRKKFEEFLKKNNIKSKYLFVNSVFDYISMEIPDSGCYQNLYDKIQKVQLIYVYYDGCIFPTIENDRIRDEFLTENILPKANNLNQNFYNGFE